MIKQGLKKKKKHGRAIQDIALCSVCDQQNLCGEEKTHYRQTDKVTIKLKSFVGGSMAKRARGPAIQGCFLTSRMNR